MSSVQMLLACIFVIAIGYCLEIKYGLEIPPAVVAAQEKLPGEMKATFIPRLNQYRREVAKKLNWGNMNELAFSITEASSLFWPSNFTNANLNDTLNDAIARSEILVKKVLDDKEKFCQNDEERCWGGEHINPRQEFVSCQYGCVKYVDRSIICKEYNYTCSFAPDFITKEDKWWNTLTTGPAGSACDSDRHNNDGLCSLGAQTTTLAPVQEDRNVTESPASSSELFSPFVGLFVSVVLYL